MALVKDCATLEVDPDGLSFAAGSIVAEEITKDSEYAGTLAGLLLEEAEPLERQRPQVRFFLEEHLHHLALLATVDAWGRPALLPVRKPRVLLLDGLELAALQRGGLGMFDRVLDRTLSIGVLDAADICCAVVVPQQCGENRVQLRRVEIRLDNPLLQIIQHNILDTSAEAPEHLLVQTRPGPLIGFPDDLAEGLARVLQRHHVKPRPAVLAVAVERERTLAEIDLTLFPGTARKDVKSIRIAHPQRAHEALDRVVPMGEPVPLDEILVDALRVATELDLLLDPGAALLAGRAGLLGRPSRWPGGGVCGPETALSRPPEPVATPGEFGPAVPSGAPCS